MDNNVAYLRHLDSKPHPHGAVSQQPSTDDLDLESLPERLDDQTLARVEAIAKAPLPSLPPVTDRHFSAALRMMLAVLPRQQADDLGGELFVQAYQRHLGHHSEEAINYLADKAIATCRWFPTVAECLEIMSGYFRNDEYTRRRRNAQTIAGRERNARNLDGYRFSKPREVTQAEVDTMPPHLIELGIKCGALERDADGNVRPAP